MSIKHTIRVLFALIGCLFFIYSSSSSAASVDGHFNDMFNQLGAKVNTTDPEAYTTSRRGVISGGSFEMRSRIIRPNIISFDPPSFKAGCGGISIYGGALSFINAQQFQDTMRAIAANSVGLLSGYAFTMALDAMCEKCGQKINALINKVQEIAGKLKNSCDAAKALTAMPMATMKEWGESARQSASVESSSTGVASDFLGGLTAASDKILEGLPASSKAKFTGNIVWKALVDRDYSAWFVSGTNGDKALELLMSLTGSFIAKESSDGKNLQYDPVPPLIDFEQFLDGGELMIYSCGGVLTDDCLNPGKVTVEVKGFRTRVQEMLFGDGSVNSGIVNKYRATSSSAAFTEKEKAFLASMRPAIAGTISAYAHRRGAMPIFQEQIVSLVSTEMASTYISQALDGMDFAITAVTEDGSRVILDRIKELRRRIPTLKSEAALYSQVMMSNLELHKDAKKTIREFK